MIRHADITACAVDERMGDGSTLRCWFVVVDGECPKHGDVSEVQKKYARTGRLTDELDLPRPFFERKPVKR